MKKWISLGCLMFLTLFLLHSGAVLDASLTGLQLWWERVLPSLFPFFVLSALFMACGDFTWFGKLLAPLMRFLGLPGEAAPCILLGMVSGYPVGAKLTNDLLRRDLLNQSQAEYLLTLSHFPGPMFLSGTVATALLGTPRAAVPLLAGQYASSAVCLFLLRPRKGHVLPLSHPVPSSEKKTSHPLTVLAGAIGDGMASMLRVGGTLVFFSAVLAALRASGALTLFCNALALLGVPPLASAALLSSSLEMTSGCVAFSSLPLSLPLRTALCSFAAAFGGLSILSQTLTFLPVRPAVYLRNQLLRGVLAGVGSYAAALFTLPEAQEVFAQAGPEMQMPLLYPAAACTALFLLARIARHSRSSSSSPFAS